MQSRTHVIITFDLFRHSQNLLTQDVVHTLVRSIMSQVNYRNAILKGHRRVLALFYREQKTI